MRQQLSDLIKMSFDSFMGNVHTIMPGKIESFDALQNKASIQPQVKKKFENGEVLSLPVITDVPVVFPTAAKGGMIFPLAAGDGCLVLFSERSMEEYIAGTGAQVAPSDPRKFALTDGICIPGLFPFSSPGTAGDGSSLVLEWEGNVKIDSKAGGNILLNGGVRGVVRTDDPTFIDVTTDPVFVAWITNVSAVLNTLAPGSVPSVPTTVTGKNTGGSTTVKAG